MSETLREIVDGVRYAGGNGTSDYWRGFNDGIDRLEAALATPPVPAVLNDGTPFAERIALATPLVPTGDERDRLMALIREEGVAWGLDHGEGTIHSWRCAHPDRYGPCDDLDTFAGDLVDRLLAAGVRLTEGGNK